MSKEQKFYKSIQDVFIGANIEGKGGFVNLMRIKSNYYRKIEDILKKDIETTLKGYPKFKERDVYFESLGLKVLHIQDIDIKKNLNGIIDF